MISSVTNLGMYLTPPILGVIADNHGPITLSIISVLGFIPSYLYVGHVFKHPDIANSESSFNLTLLCFTLIGISTSALYFSALITCTKLYPSRKLLSISLPTTCYGISSVFGSQLLRIPWFWSKSHGLLDLGRVFESFALIYIVIGLLAWIATSVVSMLNDNEEKESSKLSQEHIREQEHDHEQQPLLPRSDESTENHNPMLIFKDPMTYLFGISMLLSLGPLEMFVTNMSSLSNLIIKRNIVSLSSELLSIYAISSTLSRLSTGLLVDFLTARKISLKWILMTLLSLGFIAQLLILNLTNPSRLADTKDILWTGILFGIIYGGLFTIYPTIILIVYGEALFGTAYGSLLIPTAVGSILSCMSYAKTYDSRCHQEGATTTCINPVYYLTSTQLVLSMGVTLIVFFAWKRRRISL